MAYDSFAKSARCCADRTRFEIECILSTRSLSSSRLYEYILITCIFYANLELRSVAGKHDDLYSSVIIQQYSATGLVKLWLLA